MLGIIIFIYVIGFIIGGGYGLIKEDDAGIALSYAFLWFFWLVVALVLTTVRRFKSI